MDRTQQDYAIEFGEYLAKAAQEYMDCADTKIATGLGTNAQTELADRFVALRSAIYEFRKRAARTTTTQPR